MMAIPDYRGVWCAFEAHERPVISFHEICLFLSALGERVAPLALSLALGALVQEGMVLVVLSPEGPPRYAHRTRLEYRRALRNGGGPWAS